MQVQYQPLMQYPPVVLVQAPLTTQNPPTLESSGKVGKVLKSSRHALYWLCVVNLIIAVLFVAFDATQSDCGLTQECFQGYLLHAALVLPQVILGVWGILLSSKVIPYNTVTSSQTSSPFNCYSSTVTYKVHHNFRLFWLVSILFSVVQPFIAVNYPLTNLMEPTYYAASALTASVTILSTIITVAHWRASNP